MRPGTERQVTALAIAIAGGFVALAIASLLLPVAARQGVWLPLHLLLAGAATTAISGVMPFFSAAVANAPPAPAPIRFSAVLGVASGALIVAAGRILSPALTGPDARIAGVGALVYIGGLVLVGLATLLPLRSALGPRRIVMGAIYGVALLNIVLGVSLAALLMLGFSAVLEGWTALKPGHAWLNLFGFVSLVIAGSMLHLLPTVAGARISRTRASVVCFACVASGPLVAALGYALGSLPVAMLGATTLVVGALALGAHALNVLRARAPWTTDPGWHLFTTWSLVAGVGWFICGAIVAAATVVTGGASPVGWQLTPLIAPIGIGWVAQVLVGAWSHLVPAVGPGSPERHAAQRRTLGRAAAIRLVALNIGVAAMTFGTGLGSGNLFAVGLVAVVVAGGSAVALLVAALAERDPRRSLPTINRDRARS